jgi:hypothetical protein
MEMVGSASSRLTQFDYLGTQWNSTMRLDLILSSVGIPKDTSPWFTASIMLSLLKKIPDLFTLLL